MPPPTAKPKTKVTRPGGPNSPREHLARRRARKLPPVLQKLPASTKLLYLYLLTQGLVSYSQRDLADALGLSAYTVQQSFAHLDSIGAIAWSHEPQERTKREYKAVPMDDLT